MFLILALFAAVGVKHIQLTTMHTKLQEQEVAAQVSATKTSSYEREIVLLGQSIMDLRERNMELAKNINESKDVIETIGRVNNTIIGEIQRSVLPKTCEGKFEWLRKEALKTAPGAVQK